MHDQDNADLITENEMLRRELYASDLKCARLSGMTEDGAKEYAARMALHPSRGGFPSASKRLLGAASNQARPGNCSSCFCMPGWRRDACVCTCH